MDLMRHRQKMSGTRVRRVQQEARRGRGVEHFTKPFDGAALIDAIHCAIGRS